MAALAASLCLAPGTGQAQDSLTVAIAPFSGRGGTTVTRRVASALRDRADVVSSRAASGAARNANIEGIGATGISDFADAVNAQIAIVGEVEVTGGGRRRRHRRRSPSTRTVRMVAYAASGEELARAEFSPPAGRRGNDEIDQESQALYGRAQTAWDALHAAPPPEPEPEHHWEPEPEPEEPSEAPQDGLAFLSALSGAANGG